jgi:hypothetical protein
VEKTQAGQAREPKQSQREEEESEPVLEAADIIPGEQVRADHVSKAGGHLLDVVEKSTSDQSQNKGGNVVRGEQCGVPVQVLESTPAQDAELRPEAGPLATPDLALGLNVGQDTVRIGLCVEVLREIALLVCVNQLGKERREWCRGVGGASEKTRRALADG